MFKGGSKGYDFRYSSQLFQNIRCLPIVTINSVFELVPTFSCINAVFQRKASKCRQQVEFVKLVIPLIARFRYQSIIEFMTQRYTSVLAISVSLGTGHFQFRVPGRREYGWGTKIF